MLVGGRLDSQSDAAHLYFRTELTIGLVVSAETVNSRLDQNEPELGVLIFAVALKMLADRDGLREFMCQLLKNIPHQILKQPLPFGSTCRGPLGFPEQDLFITLSASSSQTQTDERHIIWRSLPRTRRE